MRTALLSLFLLAASPLIAGEWYVSALPAGKIKVDVMRPAASPRAAELTAKMEAAIRGNRETRTADVHAAHERFGLTGAEYAELQRLNGAAMLAKAGEVELEFVHSADGRVMLRADSSLPELSGIVFDVANDAIDTPFGRATERSEVTQDAWSGVQWKLDTVGETLGSGATIRLALGQLREDGRGILYYEAKKVEDGQVPRRANYVLVFPLATK